jgi:tetratricopeptide (TPR) repeat protein
MSADPAIDGTLPAPARGESRSLARGSEVDRYLVLDLVGRGGMGMVYRAYDPELDRVVALKVLRSSIPGSDGSEGSARMLREAQAMARLQHPNTIAVFDVGTIGDSVFLAMEFVEGKTLRAWQREQPRSVAETLAIYAQAARGLQAAHAAGLVHRDFKPDNALVGNDGRLRVVDFGLARATGTVAPVEPAISPAKLFESNRSAPLDTPLTVAGAVLGTPQYMSPEQLLGIATDARTDQFSFCVALYEALYDTRPFEGATVDELRGNVCNGRLREPPRDRKLPRRIHAVLERGLQVDPDRRFSTMTEVARALTSPRGPVRTWAVLTATAIVVAGIVGIGVLGRPRAAVCTGAAARLAGVWDADRRAAVERAFSATGLPYAGDAFTGAARRLDAYARGWSDMHTEACQATRVAGHQSEELLDLRMQCLEERRAGLKALVDLYTRADVTVVGKAVDAANSLAPLDRCANALALRAPLEPPPGDARLRVAEARAALATARAQYDLGQYAAAATLVASQLELARSLAWPPLEAEALLLRGQLETELDRLRDAAATLTDAAVAAERGRHDAVAAEAWIRRISANNQLTHYDDALVDAAHGGAFLSRIGADPRLESLLLNNRGNVLSNQSKYDEAIVDLERSLAIRLAAFGPDDPQVAGSYNNLGVTHYYANHLADAETQFRKAIEVWERAYGKEHPDVALAWNGLAAVLIDENRYDDGLAGFQHALAIYERVLPDSSDVAMALSNIGDVLCNHKQRCADALPMFERSLAIWERVFGPTHALLANALVGIADVQLASGKPQLAIAPLERALSIVDGNMNPSLRGDLELKLARSLWDSATDRARAVKLANDARAAFAHAGDKALPGLADADRWLAEHAH